ncbi:hypothetical protein ACE6H2_022910 [Prunus campanulata]
MPSFPHPGSVSICEINRDLITAESLSDDVAKDTYGKILGMVFSPVPFQPDQLARPPSPDQEDQQVATTASTKGLLQTLQGILNRSFTPLFHPNHVNLLPEVDLQGVSWHQHKHIIAFISGPNQVIVRDFEDSEGKEPCILANESQREVKMGYMIASLIFSHCVGFNFSGGICIWAASFPGSAASVRSGASSFLGTLSRGLGTPIRRGLGGISMLKWSPTGDYFFSAKFDGTFYLWETNTWTSEPWSSTSGFVKGASWDPDGHMILLAFSKSSTLGSIHFASKPPSLVMTPEALRMDLNSQLDAHLLPVELPEIMSLTNSQTIEKIAWDASGERLAVSFKEGDELYRGLIAIYDVRRTPLISASLIGFIRGPGDNPKPLAFSYHDKFKQGPLLFVDDGDHEVPSSASEVLE